MIITDNRNAEDYGAYEYYTYDRGETQLAIPLRVVRDSEDDIIDVDIFDPETLSLLSNSGLLSDIRDSIRVEKSTQEEFWNLCRLHADRHAKPTDAPVQEIRD